MGIDLRVNDVVFTLGEGLDDGKLASANCFKGGVLVYLALAVRRGETVYCAKNCTVSCFGKEFELWANLDSRGNSASMVGTSVYLYFTNLALQKVVFQTVENETVAKRALETFQKLCEHAFGAPLPDSQMHWLDNQNVVSCVLSNTRARAVFQWKANPTPP
jgi:hypothetical protein